MSRTGKVRQSRPYRGKKRLATPARARQFCRHPARAKRIKSKKSDRASPSINQAGASLKLDLGSFPSPAFPPERANERGQALRASGWEAGSEYPESAAYESASYRVPRIRPPSPPCGPPPSSGVPRRGPGRHLGGDDGPGAPADRAVPATVLLPRTAAAQAAHRACLRAPGAVPAPGPAAPGSNATPSPAPQVHADFAGLLDPSASFGAAPLPLGRSAPLQAGLQLAQASPLLAADMAATPGAMASVDLSEPDDPELNLPDQAQPDTTVAEAQKSILEVPLPAPRPFELRAPAVAEPRVLTPPANRRTRTAVLPNTPADDRTFFEKLFGVKRSAETALGYAAPQESRRRRPRTAAQTRRRLQAVVVLPVHGDLRHQGAQRSTMPNGERLEAHSGLGDRLDDPRFVHERMKGLGRPYVYDLSSPRGGYSTAYAHCASRPSAARRRSTGATACWPTPSCSGRAAT